MYHGLLFLPKNDRCLSPKFQGSLFGSIKGYKEDFLYSFGGKQQNCRDRVPLSFLSAILREATALVTSTFTILYFPRIFKRFKNLFQVLKCQKKVQKGFWNELGSETHSFAIKELCTRQTQLRSVVMKDARLKKLLNIIAS